MAEARLATGVASLTSWSSSRFGFGISSPSRFVRIREIRGSNLCRLLSCVSWSPFLLLAKAKHPAVAAFAADDEDPFADGGSGGDGFASVVLPAFLAVG